MVSKAKQGKAFQYSSIFCCWVEQKCPLIKDFYMETQDGSSSYSIVSWSTSGPPTSVGITHKSASSQAAAGGPYRAWYQTASLTPRWHWQQVQSRTGVSVVVTVDLVPCWDVRRPTASTGVQCTGLLMEAVKAYGEQGRSNGVSHTKADACGGVGMGTVQSLVNQQSCPRGAGFRFLANS